MKSIRVLSFLIAITFVAACGEAPKSNNANNANTAATPEVQKLSTVDRPQKLKDMMVARGEQDAAAPTLKIVEPKADAAVANSTVKVKLDISGDLKGYKPHMDMETKMGNHIHVILDNQPYEAYYNLEQEFELRNVSDGDHTLRVFPSRPWHESYKNDGAFQMVKFSVKNGGADTSKPATANGNTMANANTAPTPEGKDMKESTAGAVDPKKPMLTFSRPKGEYKGPDADAIMIDFWLTNAILFGDPILQSVGRKPQPSRYRVRYSVDDGTPAYIESREPIWLTGWIAGKHTVKLELVDLNGNVVDNGGYNSTTREITITK